MSVPRIDANGCSLLPTPSGVSSHGKNHVVGRLDEWGGSSNPFRGTPLGRVRCASFEEWMMGFPMGFTALTLILSLQASYAAPLILLSQNRQDDRDRVQIEQDRQRAERNLADTEYLAREVVALRLAMKDMATKDFIRAELRALLEELENEKPAAKKPVPRKK